MMNGRTDGQAILDAQVCILLYTVKCISLRRLDMKNVPGLSNILFGGHLLISYSLKFYNLTLYKYCQQKHSSGIHLNLIMHV